MASVDIVRMSEAVKELTHERNAARSEVNSLKAELATAVHEAGCDRVRLGAVRVRLGALEAAVISVRDGGADRLKDELYALLPAASRDGGS